MIRSLGPLGESDSEYQTRPQQEVPAGPQQRQRVELGAPQEHRVVLRQGHLSAAAWELWGAVIRGSARTCNCRRWVGREEEAPQQGDDSRHYGHSSHHIVRTEESRDQDQDELECHSHEMLRCDKGLRASLLLLLATGFGNGFGSERKVSLGLHASALNLLWRLGLRRVRVV